MSCRRWWPGKCGRWPAFPGSPPLAARMRPPRRGVLLRAHGVTGDPVFLDRGVAGDHEHPHLRRRRDGAVPAVDLPRRVPALVHVCDSARVHLATFRLSPYWASTIRSAREGLSRRWRSSSGRSACGGICPPEARERGLGTAASGARTPPSASPSTPHPGPECGRGRPRTKKLYPVLGAELQRRDRCRTD